MEKAIEKTKINWKWKPKRWWIGLIIFWFVSTTGAGLIAQAAVGVPHAEGAFIKLIMIIFLIHSAVTNRNNWSVFIRILWVFAAWVIQSLLLFPAAFSIGLLAHYAGRPELAERGMDLSAALPVVIWGMRLSKFFVEPETKK